MKKILLKINNEKRTINEFFLKTGQTHPLSIKAQAQVNYLFIEEDTGLAPQKVVTKRIGNDLAITFEGNETTSPDLVLEGFYSEDTAAYKTSYLVGQNQAGEIYHYLPEYAEKADLINTLVSNQSAVQTLGGEAVSALWSFSPWLVGAASLGAAALTMGVVEAFKDAEDHIGTDSKPQNPTDSKTENPTGSEKENPTDSETGNPTDSETGNPTDSETGNPTDSETGNPTDSETGNPTDSGNENISDNKTVLPLIEEAKQKAQSAKVAVQSADENDDGFISADEKAKVDEAIQAAQEAKVVADKAVKGLQEGLTKDDYQAQVNAITIPETVEVTNVSDVEAKIAKAQELAKAAEAAKTAADTNNDGIISAGEKAAVDAAIKAAQDAKSAADTNNDGIISAGEKAAVDAAIKAAQDAKSAADAAVKALPDGTGEAGYQAQVNAITIPETVEVTKVSDVEAKIAKAQELAKAAEAAKTAVDANKDNIISSEEKVALDAAIEKAQETKLEADKAVKALPTGSAKDGYQAQVNEITIPDTVAETEIPTPEPVVERLVNQDAVVKGNVWLDSKADGVKDSTESGIENVMLELKEADTGKVIATKTTDGKGNFEFTGLAPNRYIIDVVESKGGMQNRVYTKAYASSGVAIDSDVINSKGETSAIIVRESQIIDNIHIGVKEKSATDVNYQLPTLTSSQEVINTLNNHVEGEGIARYVTIVVDPNIAKQYGSNKFALSEVKVWSGSNLVSLNGKDGVGSVVSCSKGWSAVRNLFDNKEHTSSEFDFSNPIWIQVDLGKPMPISRVQIMPRDTESKYLNGATVLLSDERIAFKYKMDENGNLVDDPNANNETQQLAGSNDGLRALISSSSDISSSIYEMGQIKNIAANSNAPVDFYNRDITWNVIDKKPEFSGKLNRALKEGESLYLSNSKGEKIGDVTLEVKQIEETYWSFETFPPEEKTRYVNEYYWKGTLLNDLAAGSNQCFLTFSNAGKVETLKEFNVNVVGVSHSQITEMVILADNLAQTTDITATRISNDNLPTLQGKLSEPLSTGEEVRLYHNDKFIGIAKTQFSEKGEALWSFQTTLAITEPQQTFSAKIYNRFTGEEKSTAQAEYHYLDMLKSSLWFEGSMGAAFDKPIATELLKVNGVLDSELPSGNHVAIYADDKFMGNAVVESDNKTWSLQLKEHLSVGKHNIQWRIENIATNGSIPTTTFETKSVDFVSDAEKLTCNAKQLHKGFLFSGYVAPNQEGLYLEWGGKTSQSFKSDALGKWEVPFFDNDCLLGKQAPLNLDGQITKAVLKDSSGKVVGEFNVQLDVTSPEVKELSIQDSTLNPGASSAVTIKFTESVSDDFVLNKIKVFGGTLSNFQGTGDTRTATFTADNNVSKKAVIAITQNSFKDGVGNFNGKDAILEVKVGNTAIIEPISSDLVVRASKQISLDLRSPGIDLSNPNWKVEISNLPQNVTLSKGTYSNGKWVVSGSDLKDLMLVSNKSVKGDFLFNVSYLHNENNQWKTHSQTALNLKVVPWITGGGNDDAPHNFSHYLDAWNQGIVGYSGKDITLIVRENTGNLGVSSFDATNILPHSKFPASHGSTVMLRAAGSINSWLTGIAYDAKISWNIDNINKAEIFNFSISMGNNYSPVWTGRVPDIKFGRNGLGEIWAIGASNWGENTALTVAPKSPTVMTIGAIHAADGTAITEFAKGEATHLAAVGDNGTSCSTPIVAGTTALMLEADRNLGFRDIQSILAYTGQYYATTTSNPYLNFGLNGAKTLNGTGLHFAKEVGFGIVNIHAAVLLAKDWRKGDYDSKVYHDKETRPNDENLWWEYKTDKVTTEKVLSRSASATTEFKINVTKDVNLESIVLHSNINDPALKKLTITVISPNGTVSKIAEGTAVGSWNGYFTATSKRFWGENAKGEWTIKFGHTEDVTVDTKIKDVGLSLYGDGIMNDDRYVYTDEFSRTYNNMANEKNKADMLILNDIDGGNDSIMASAVTTNVTIALGKDDNTNGSLLIDNKVVVITKESQIENVFGGEGHDLLIGNKYTNFLVGNGGNDIVISNKADVRLEGNDGNDWLAFGNAKNVLGGAGNDHFLYLSETKGQDTSLTLDTVKQVLTDFNFAQDQLYTWKDDNTLQAAFLEENDKLSWKTVKDQSLIEQAKTFTTYFYQGYTPTQNMLSTVLPDDKVNTIIM
ncbi:GA-like domain-containing protein [Gallibacterium anatis]|uniref:P/Homo B domain-containing protein n=1 Tax=Gallibacterium anatis TaxID=750 RepID=A0A0A2XL12_9PAST|nr:SdrD B-like domain-containing protein [Gallibacterium anatis]KGQ32898.1 hypothetical protein JP32_04130 [Gallibacterium anatis]